MHVVLQGWRHPDCRVSDCMHVLHRAPFRRTNLLRAKKTGSPQSKQDAAKCCIKTRLHCLASSTVDMPETKATLRTQRVFEELEQRRASGQQAGGAGGGTTYQALKAADAAWAKVRNMQPGTGVKPSFVQNVSSRVPGGARFDVVVCGGTLGVFLACALQLRGFRVAIVERGPLRGREQEWNISRKELNELVEAGLLSSKEAEECISSEFNPVRAGFHGSVDVWTRDVLNLGIRPDKIIAKVRRTFDAAGGKVLEFTAGEGVEVYSDGVLLRTPQPGRPSSKGDAGNGAILPSDPDAVPVTGRLLIDCMGNFSPIVRQMRWGQKPDGICLVVGSCGRGFQNNTTGDVIYTNTPIQPPSAPVPDVQYFWEAFPAGSGPSDRTTYMFTYIDADPRRPSLEALLEDYWRLMPEYQGVSLDDIEVLRILFGFFPTYRASPLRPQFDRILQVGDASGIQSPLSFGGFGALSRHLPRLTAAVSDALEADDLDKDTLAGINAYSPGLSGAWMLQRAMSVRPGKQPDPQFINTLLGANFSTMQRLGEPVLKPFLQDVIQFGPLAKTLGLQMVANPGFIPQILQHVGIMPLLDWTQHFISLGAYTALYKALKPLDGTISKQLSPALRLRWKRALEAWQYGSGSDYRF